MFSPSMPADTKPVLAAIDVGTNSVHMVIVRIFSDPPHFTVLARAKEMVRLGETCRHTSCLTPVAMERAIVALKRFRELAESYGAHDIVAVATSAVREASNGAQFLEEIRRQVGLVVDLISGREEARRIYLGALSALPFEGQPHVIVDIGGGSTELILGDGEEPSFLSSVKLGAVRLTQDFIQSDPISKSDYIRLEHYIRLRLEPVIAELQAHGSWVRLVGTSGTIESLALLDAVLSNPTTGSMKRSAPPATLHGYTFSRERLCEIVQQLQGMSMAQRRKLPGIPERRADVILAGSLILLETMNLLGASQLTVCERALREGLVVDWMAERGLIASYLRYQSSIRERSVQAMAQQYHSDWEHVSQVARFALSLFDQTQRLDLHSWTEADRHLLWAAAVLHTVGHFVNHAAHHKHTYYLIRNGGLLGYTEEEVEVLANLARYHRNSPPKRRHENWANLPKDLRLLVSQLSSLLRLATALECRRKQAIQMISLERSPDSRTLVLQLKPVRPEDDCALELWNLEDEKQIFEAEFNLNLHITCAVPVTRY